MRRIDWTNPVWPALAGVASLAASVAIPALGGDAGVEPTLLTVGIAGMSLSAAAALIRTRQYRKQAVEGAAAELRAKELEICLALAESEGRRSDAVLQQLAADGFVSEPGEDPRERCTRELLALKGQFVSGVGHELRTPLASIKAYTEMLLDGEAADDATRHEFYEIIQAESNRLSRLIENILSISRIESGLATIDLRDSDLGALLADSVRSVEVQARLKKVALAVESAVVEGATRIRCDRELVQQVIVNLLANAIRHSPEGSEIQAKLVLSDDASRAVFRVRDAGPGIDPALLPSVFDKFYAGTVYDGRAVQGAGLSLSLVRHVVETVHGGKVYAESKPGQGSTFGFELELCPAAVPEHEQKTAGDEAAAVAGVVQ